jgi:2,3-bisphosphoglycerate-independent phosphoglycerate mutase
MKHALIIPDGAADDPLDALSGRTPIEAADTPNMDWIASHGRQGLARTVPEGFESGSDVAIMSLLGYDPAVYHTGRAPLEAAAQNIPLEDTDWVFRLNLVTVIDGVMKDHSAGGISDADAAELLDLLRAAIQIPGLEIRQGVSYRNLAIFRGGQFDVTTKPPHEIPDEPIEKWLPRGEGADVLNRIMTISQSLFAKNTRSKATQAWLWGQGKAPKFQSFHHRFGVARGAMITGVDLLRGLANLLGWTNLTVPGMTSFHDTDYAGQGKATAAALDEFDIVVSHVEAPDEASHQADWKTKVASIEAIDRHVVGPVLQKLKTFPAWRILVMPDHPTNITTRKHGYAPPPFCIAGSDVTDASGKPYSESAAAAGERLDRGHELMGYFLGRTQ